MRRSRTCPGRRCPPGITVRWHSRARCSSSCTGSGFGLEAADLRWAAAQWVPDVARHADGDVSPLHAHDLSGLPPAAVVTAEHDPLRDEGDLYAARLAAAGVSVVHRCEPGLPHGFVQGMDLTSAIAAAAVERFIADVRVALRSPA